MLSQALEPRQLLAGDGPELVGIQPNEGALIDGGEVLRVSPKELVFRFDDKSDIDPRSLQDGNGIRITRAGADGGFESATALTDLGSSDQVRVEFIAAQSGAAGNGLRVRLFASDRGTSSQSVGVSVDREAGVVQLQLNSNPNRPSVVRDLILAVEGNADARDLIEVVQVSGPSLFPIGQTIGQASGSLIEVELAGANAAQFESDLLTGGDVLARFVATETGRDGVGTTVSIVLGGTIRQVTNTATGIRVNLPVGSTVSELIQTVNAVVPEDKQVFAQLEVGDGSRVLAGNVSFTLVGATDTVVEPGFIGLGDTPHEVVFRFAETLPQDTYQIDILAVGDEALSNVEGDPVNGGRPVTRKFSIDTAPQVSAVVPTPVRRLPDGTLAPEVNVIEVYFSESIPKAIAEDADVYKLIFTRDTATNRDDHVVTPFRVIYDEPTRVARLEFTDPLSRVRDPLDPSRFLQGAIRLKIGTAQDPRLLPPKEVAVSSDPGDSFDDSVQIDPLDLQASPGEIKTVRFVGENIFNQPGAFDLQFPGGPDTPGVRNIRSEDPTRLDRTVPLDVWRNPADSADGISTIFYDFPDRWQGDDPNVGGTDRFKEYINVITDQQKQRIREVLSQYSQYLGVQFVETGRDSSGAIVDPADARAAAHIAIAVGEIYGATSLEGSSVGGLTVATRPLDGEGRTFLDTDVDVDVKLAAGNSLLVMDFQDFDESVDDQLGGEFFRGAFFGVGQVLGYGYADHLPQPVTQATRSVLNPGEDNEPLFPSPSDIVNGQYLYRPESSDIDLYRFELGQSGSIKIQTVAERLETASLLDTALRLYRLTGTDAAGNELWAEIAANDDYFSNDSLIELELGSGSYIVGVSSSGNTVYDPVISGTGIGGLSEGDYELSISFEASQQTRGIKDAVNGQFLDGDLDGREGGDYNFWFRATDTNSTIFVDSSFSLPGNGTPGTLTNPYRQIDEAIARVQQLQQVDPDGEFQIRVVGGSYTVGLDNRGLPLPDGRDVVVPKNTQLVIDAGVVWLMSDTRIGVGSTTDAPSADRSGGSIQVLGTPDRPVVFRSARNDNAARAGDWGGIDIRSDIDALEEGRTNFEELGVFMNHIQFADIRHGGGKIDVNGVPTVVSPIELALTRATVVNSRITDSADAAIAATPDTFAETRFDEFRFQRDSQFTPDYMRVGPHIRGNEIMDNSINGLFIRIETRAGEDLEALQINARFDDTDIVHVLTENLLIEGSAGGPNANIDPPSILQVDTSVETGGDIPAGNYDFVLTFVTQQGYETPGSDRITVLNVPNNGLVRFTSLPTISQELREQGFIGRRLYRAPAGTDAFIEVGRLNSDSRQFPSASAAPGSGLPRNLPDQVSFARFDPSLKIEPGTVVKLNGARIDVILDGHLYAEGTEALPIVMTSLSDNRFGAGGSFDTNELDDVNKSLLPGDWGGVYVGFGAEVSLDNAVVAGGGGSARVEGGFANFNVIEVHQADLRVANSRFEDNSDGRSFVNAPDDLRSIRVGRGDNASGTIFVRGSQPIIVGNDFVDGKGPVASFDVNSFTFAEETDYGRSTGPLMTGAMDTLSINGNSGPLIHGNRIGTTRLNTTDPANPNNRNFACSDPLGQNPAFDEDGNVIACTLNGLEIRGGKVATEAVLDDVDIVHIVRDTIEIPNQHIYGGLRLESDARGSLVLKFQTQDPGNEDALERRQAGIVAGGTLVTAEDEYLDIDDRIGGSLQVVGHPDFPVVLTSLADDTVGAGFRTDDAANLDTDNNGVRLDANGDPVTFLTSSSDDDPPPPPGLPLSPEYDRTDRANADNFNIIDDDVDDFNLGFFEAQIDFGGEVLDNIRVTYNNIVPADGPLGPLLTANFDFLYTTYVDVDFDSPFANALPEPLSATFVTQNPILIGDDRVRSAGFFFLNPGDITPAAPAGRRVDWVAESFFINNRATLYTTISFEAEDGQPFQAGPARSVRAISYVDQGIPDDANDILYQKGNYGESDFRAITVNTDRRIGFSHGGIYENDRLNQNQAQYLGWTADEATDLLNLITQDAYRQSIDDAEVDPNLLDLATEMPIEGQTEGTLPRGTDDIATAFVWELNRVVDEAKITTFVEFLPGDPANPPTIVLPPSLDGAGTWDGLTIREAASDANIGVTGEIEPSNLGNVRVNDTNQYRIPGQNEIPGQAQFLGELAPSVTSGDNVRRLGFTVEGTIATRDDLDVYSFIGEAGTQVWLDIDRTNSRLDTVVELIDENGFVRALSNDSLSESQGAGPVSADTTTARPLNVDPIDPTAPTSAFQDVYSTNPRDAGMRIVLPGLVGQRFLYHIRVRSDNEGSLLNPAEIRSGKTSGAYQLQIRLQEADVFPGTQVRYSDVRFATNGVQIVGGPYRSPIGAEDTETRVNNTNSINDAQRLSLYDLVRYDNNGNIIGIQDDELFFRRNEGRGPDDVRLDDLLLQNPASPLASDQLAKSISGFLESEDDVDWYQFDVEYQQLTRDNTALLLSTIFDLDYADGIARANTALYVFDEAGQVVLAGTDSNVADDQSSAATVSDLSRGSFDTGDPFIGTAELSEGTYFVAVVNQSQIPNQLDQFYEANPNHPLLRLEPIDSITRIVEDRIYGTNADGLTVDAAGNLIGDDDLLRDPTTGEVLLDNDGNPRRVPRGTASAPEVPVLFDSDSIIEHSFDDTLLYVTTARGLEIVNPFTGQQYLPDGVPNVPDNLGNYTDEIRDIAFRANGELFAFSGFDNRVQNDSNYFYYRVDPGDATLSAPLNGGPIATTFEVVQNVVQGVIVFQRVVADTGLDIQAMALSAFNDPAQGPVEGAFFVANRTRNLSANARAASGGNVYDDNILYEFNPNNGQTSGAPNNTSFLGALTNTFEVGHILTEAPVDAFRTQLGVTDATEIGPDGVARPSLFDGDSFILSNGTDSRKFEFDQSFTLIAGAEIRLAAVDLMSLGQTVTVVADASNRATFEFVTFDPPNNPNNIPISLVDNQGRTRTPAQIAGDLAAAINQNVPGLGAAGQGSNVVFTFTPQSLLGSGSVEVSGRPASDGDTVIIDGRVFEIDTLGNGAAIINAVEVPVSNPRDPVGIIRSLAETIRREGIRVSSAGTQLSLPDSTTVDSRSNPSVPGVALELTGSPGVASDTDVRIPLFPTDTAGTISQRIAALFAGPGNLPGMTVDARGGSVEIGGSGFIQFTPGVTPTGNLVAGGVSPQKLDPITGLPTDANGLPLVENVTGIDVVNDQLYAVTDTGGLFRVNQSALGQSSTTNVGEYVKTATDLVGIPFSGLRAGPATVQNGELQDLLFGVTQDGEIYAFNTRGELQNVFAGGRSVVSTGIEGALGLDFSVVDFNLWHVSEQRGDDPGHGINETFNNARPTTPGGTSLAFNFESAVFDDRYPTGEEPGSANNPGNLELTYNVPGGARGVVQSNPFSLEGYAADDLPMLYFNYYMETEGVAGTDALRVYVVTDDGVEHLVSTNNTVQGPESNDDEFDDPDPLDGINTEVQPLFDVTGGVDSWRQARVPLREFAGQTGLSLRIEFSTSGTTSTLSDSMRVISGRALAETGVDEREFIISRALGSTVGDSYVVDLAPTVSFPSGRELANAYADPNQVAVISVYDQEFVLQVNGDPNVLARPVAAGQLEIDLLVGSPAGTTLSQLSAEDIASAVDRRIQSVIPTATADFDDPPGGQNDLLIRATPLPYAGGNLRIEGAGRIGPAGSVRDPDVDLVSLEVRQGALLEVEMLFDDTINNSGGVIRFFDEAGNDLLTVTPQPGVQVATRAQFVSPFNGLIYIGFSGQGNSTYNPQQSSAVDGIAGTYTASVGVYVPSTSPPVTDFDFSDPADDPGGVQTRNDTLSQATSLPYNGRNQRIEGTGHFGDPNNPGAILDDVDLVQLTAGQGALIEVDLRLDNTAGGVGGVIRFFDNAGNDLLTVVPQPGQQDPTTAAFVAPFDGQVFIGLSGAGNASYNPVDGSDTAAGIVGPYTATVNVVLPSTGSEGNLVEFFDETQTITATPAGLFSVTQRIDTGDAIPIPVSRFMSPSEVASAVQRVIANRLTYGDMSLVPTAGSLVSLPSFELVDSGPFGNQGDRNIFGGGFDPANPENASIYATGARQNSFEGVYLDDFIIGFAERGELVTNTPTPGVPADTGFSQRIDSLPTVTGAYQLEIRDGSEYVASGRIVQEVDFVQLQRFGADPIVIAIDDQPYGFRADDPAPLDPATEVISKTDPRRGQFSPFSLPTVDLDQVLANRGLNLLSPDAGVVELASLGIGLVALDDSFVPLERETLIVPTEARFRTFNTNARLSDAFSFEAFSGASLVDGATFEIADSQGRLTFEFDVDNQLIDGQSIPIAFDPSDSATTVADAIIDAINSPTVGALLDVNATRANATRTANTSSERDFRDARVNLYGDVSLRDLRTDLAPAFQDLQQFGQRGDSNRDRVQQGTILVENSRFLFSSESGLEITRDESARVLSPDARDEFPTVRSFPQNMVELNSEGLIPGAVVQNSVFAYNANNGIRLRGVAQGGSSIITPVGFDQIVNNTLIGGLVTPGEESGPQVFASLLFDRGGISFADEVVEVNLGLDVDQDFADEQSVLSSPDLFGQGFEPLDGQFSLSLGTRGSVTVRFTNNLLTGNDSSTPDLVIFETLGTDPLGNDEDIEAVRVEVSRDNISYFDVGIADSLNRSIDIDQFGFDSNDRFAYVRLTDLDSDNVSNQFGPAGADIDAVGALSTVPAFGYTPGSQGIVVEENTGPTLLNNIVANFQTGVAVSGPNPTNPDDVDVSRDRTILGAMSYFRNTFAGTGVDAQALGLFSQTPDPFEQIFVDPTRLLFAPQDKASTIDSSIDSLEDRASLRTVRTAVGLSPTPILAPSTDINGQLRIDDPEVDTPVGLGQRVFKDRGAEDQADDTEPRITLISPRADDRLFNAGTVVTTSTRFDSFDIQIVDGILTIDTGPGVGFDDASIDGSLIRLTRQLPGGRDVETLEEGKDYRFAFEPGDNIIRLTPIAGIWEEGVYVVQLLGDETGIIEGETGVRYADGALTQLDVDLSERFLMEVDTGINITVVADALETTLPPPVGTTVPNIEGQTLSILDGLSDEPIIYEITTTNDPVQRQAIIDRGNEPVRVGQQATAEQIAAALAEAINRPLLEASTAAINADRAPGSPIVELRSPAVFATAVDNRLQLLDAVAKSTDEIRGEPAFAVSAAAAYRGADIKLSDRLVGSEISGKSLRVYDGLRFIDFVLTTPEDPQTAGDNDQLVVVSSTDKVREIANKLAAAIAASDLQLSTGVPDEVEPTLLLRGDPRLDGTRGAGGLNPQLTLAVVEPGTTAASNETAFRLTNYTLDARLTDNAYDPVNGMSIDGASITIFDGSVERTFEYDNNGVILQQGVIAVPIDVMTTTRDMVTALIDAIQLVPDLNVQVVGAANTFRITGDLPVAVTTINDAVEVSGRGEIGASPGFGIKIPADGIELSDTVDDGQIFSVGLGRNAPQSFEIDFDGLSEDPTENHILVTAVDRTLDAVADAIAQTVSSAGIGVLAQNVGAGRVVFDNLATRLDVTNTVLQPLGIPGFPAPLAIVVPLDATPEQVAEAYSQALISYSTSPGNSPIAAELNGDRVLIDGADGLGGLNPIEDLKGTSVITDRISDKVGNRAEQFDTSSFRIFVGGGFDYGDAPSPYTSSAEDGEGGPRHLVDTSFALWKPDATIPGDRPISPEPDAVLPDGDEDNGVRAITPLQPGFSANFEITVFNENDRPFFVDAWFDWNANGVFEVDEVERYGSVGTGQPLRPLVATGVNVVSVDVPSTVQVPSGGPLEIYARFRLSEVGDGSLPDPFDPSQPFDMTRNLGPNGDPVKDQFGNLSSGEVEDLQLFVTNNPFQNPKVDLQGNSLRWDVNDSGTITPIDALQIINAIGRNDGNPIELEGLSPLPDPFPIFPDVSGDSLVSNLDALQVINQVARILNGTANQAVGEGEATSFVALEGGVMVSQPTLLGDVLMAQSRKSGEGADPEIASVDQPAQAPPPSSTSVFDNASVMAIDAIVDSLAEDTASARDDEETVAVDQLFASL